MRNSPYPVRKRDGVWQRRRDGNWESLTVVPLDPRERTRAHPQSRSASAYPTNKWVWK